MISPWLIETKKKKQICHKLESMDKHKHKIVVFGKKWVVEFTVMLICTYKYRVALREKLINLKVRERTVKTWVVCRCKQESLRYKKEGKKWRRRLK